MKRNIVPEPQTFHIQNLFLERLKSRLRPGVGLAEELADILNISIDSAYRRIRGEKTLTLAETWQITSKYGICLDDLLSQKRDNVTFTYTKLTDSSTSFQEYFERITGHLKAINAAPNKKLYYVAEEMPLFYSFFNRRYADFKLFYWQRSVLNAAEYQVSKYEFGKVPKEMLDNALSSYQEYMGIPSVEIWTDRTVLTGIRQISFYLESGLLSKEQTLELFADYRASIEQIGQMAESARKNPADMNETFQMYICDLVLGTNCIYAIAGERRISYITFNTLNSLNTDNSQFCEETEYWIKNLEKKSTLISGVAAKQRYQFFKGMFRTIDDKIEEIRNRPTD